MQTLNKKEVREYIKNNIVFKLKDFDKTNEKYKNYKNIEFKEVNKEFKDIIKHYDYIEFFENYKNHNQYFYILLDKLAKEKTKENIRYLKTEINSIFYRILINIASNRSNNDNQTKNFAIKLYLTNYKGINKGLKQILLIYSLI